MTVLSTAPFKSCAPAEEFFDYPLFFPKPNFRGRPAPPPEEEEEVYGEGRLSGELTPEEVQAAAEQRAAVEEQKRLEEEAAKAVPKKNVQKEKFEAISGGKPTLEAQKAGDLARSMGFAPSQADIANLHAQFGDDVTFEQFQQWQKEHCLPHKAADKAPDLEVFFKDFDTGNAGTLTRQQVRTLLGSYGEALTEQEVDVIFKELGITGDTIDYHEFVEKLLADEPAE